MLLFSFFAVKEQLAHDPDNEVATTSLKISLCCPVIKNSFCVSFCATSIYDFILGVSCVVFLIFDDIFHDFVFPEP